MTLDQGIALFAALVSFTGLLFVALQLRDTARAQTSQSLVRIYDINRQLITLGFSHPEFFAILADSKNVNPEWERRYLQLWLNHFSLVNSYLQMSMLTGELEQSLISDLKDFFTLKNASRQWRTYGKFYPESFQDLVNGILKKNEPPHNRAAHRTTKAKRHNART